MSNSIFYAADMVRRLRDRIDTLELHYSTTKSIFFNTADERCHHDTSQNDNEVSCG